MFLIVLDGSKDIDAGSTVLFQAGPTQALFLRRGSYVMDAALSAETGRYRCMVFFFDEAFLSEFTERHGVVAPNPQAMPGGSPQVFAIPLSGPLQACIQSFFPYFEYHGAHLKNLLRLKLDEIILNILDADAGNAFLFFLKQMVSDKKHLLSRLVEENLREQITVEELAKKSGLSLSTFKREFKELFQTSPKEWMNQKRLERARFLLASTDKNVTEIAHEVGFDSLSHFIEFFKDNYKVTPKQYQISQKRQKLNLPR